MSIWDQEATTPASADVPPAGPHHAHCVAMIDMGSHEEEVKDEKTDANGQKTTTSKMKTFRKLFLAFELAPLGDGSKVPIVIGRPFNLGFTTKSALRLFLESWRGKKYNEGEKAKLDKLLGMACLVTIKHTTSGERTFAKIDGVSMPMRGTDGKPVALPKPTHQPIAYEIAPGPLPELGWLPWSFGEKVADVIQRSPEWKSMHGQGGSGGQQPSTNGGPGPATTAETPASAKIQEEEIPF